MPIFLQGDKKNILTTANLFLRKEEGAISLKIYQAAW